MTDQMQNLLSELEAVLEDERQALTSGDVPALSSLVPRKQAAMERIGATGASPAEGTDERTLARLREKAQRNQDLMDHALRGLRDVAARIGAAPQDHRAHETYDSGGRRHALGRGGSPSFERRA